MTCQNFINVSLIVQKRASMHIIFTFDKEETYAQLSTNMITEQIKS